MLVVTSYTSLKIYYQFITSDLVSGDTNQTELIIAILITVSVLILIVIVVIITIWFILKHKRKKKEVKPRYVLSSVVLIDYF